jgi:hypothetical protein
MRKAILISSLIAGALVFGLIATTHAGELDSLQNVINTNSKALYSTWYGTELRMLPADSVPKFLSYLLIHRLVDSVTVYETAQKVQTIARLSRNAAHLKVRCNLIASGEGTSEVKKHSHTVALIDRWFENSALEDTPTPTISGKLHADFSSLDNLN